MSNSKFKFSCFFKSKSKSAENSSSSINGVLIFFNFSFKIKHLSFKPDLSKTERKSLTINFSSKASLNSL